MLSKVNFKNPNSGRQPRANIFLRMGRMLRRKRVAYARAQAWSTLEHAQRQVDRFVFLANRYDVPIDPAPTMPELPALPGRDWVEWRQAMTDLVPPVRSSPAPNELKAAT